MRLKEKEIPEFLEKYAESLRGDGVFYRQALEHNLSPSSTGEKYTSTCMGCKKAYSVYTQQDECPEYYTDVMLVCCECHELVPFSLPVN